MRVNSLVTPGERGPLFLRTWHVASRVKSSTLFWASSAATGPGVSALGVYGGGTEASPRAATVTDTLRPRLLLINDDNDGDNDNNDTFFTPLSRPYDTPDYSLLPPTDLRPPCLRSCLSPFSYKQDCCATRTSRKFSNKASRDPATTAEGNIRISCRRRSWSVLL